MYVKFPTLISHLHCNGKTLELSKSESQCEYSAFLCVTKNIGEEMAYKKLKYFFRKPITYDDNLKTSLLCFILIDSSKKIWNGDVDANHIYEWISTCLWPVDLKDFQQFSNKIRIKNRYFRNKNVCFYLKISLIWTRAIYIYISAETLKHSPDNIFTRKQRRHKLIRIIDYYRNLELIYFLITNTHA